MHDKKHPTKAATKNIVFQVKMNICGGRSTGKWV